MLFKIENGKLVSKYGKPFRNSNEIKNLAPESEEEQEFLIKYEIMIREEIFNKLKELSCFEFEKE